jgi:ParB-like chromosome segregation protein Spo0J
MGKRGIVKVKIEDIRLNGQQDVVPYQTPEQQKEIEKKVQQLRKEGQLKPIRLYDDYTLRDGHLRLYAAKKLEWQEIDATIEPRPEKT